MNSLYLHFILFPDMKIYFWIYTDVKIGFEREVYTVQEGTNLESQVFITKADGFSTEEDIDIRITAIPQTAQLGKPQYLGFMQNRFA